MKQYVWCPNCQELICRSANCCYPKCKDQCIVKAKIDCDTEICMKCVRKAMGDYLRHNQAS